MRHIGHRLDKAFEFGAGYFIDEQGEQNRHHNIHQVSDQVNAQRIHQHAFEVKIAEYHLEILEAIPGAGEYAFNALYDTVVFKSQQQAKSGTMENSSINTVPGSISVCS